MSFIDYNFFPILFFLAWNILTTKQFRPNIYRTSDCKTLPALSVFSLTNPINKSTLPSHLNHSKKSDILEFVPEFRFLSLRAFTNKNTDALFVSSVQPCFENTKHGSVLETNKANRIIPKQTSLGITSLPNKFINKLVWAENQKSIATFGTLSNNDTSMFKNKLFKHRILSPSKKAADGLYTIARPVNWFPNGENMGSLTNHNLVNHNWKENFKAGLFDFTYLPKTKRFVSSFFPYNSKTKSLFIGVESSLNLASVLENTSFKANSFQTAPENRFQNLFFEGLCFRQNNTYFWKKIQKPWSYTWFLNKITYPQAFSFLWIKNHTRKLNSINSIQKRRSNIRLLLRSQSQTLYSLNRFQMALCFSKIWQPSIFFTNNYQFNVASSFLNKLEIKDPSVLSTSTKREFPELYDSMFNSVHNKLELQTRATTQLRDHAFTKLDQETHNVNRYKRKKKNWYMKIQFFQHVAWNMKHKISDYFSDVEYLLDTINLPLKNTDGFVTKPFQLESYQDFSTNGDKNFKIPKEDLKTKPFTNKTKGENFSNFSKNRKSVWLNDSSERKSKTSSLLKTHTFFPSYLLRIYSGSWYYENLAPQYTVFNDKIRTLWSLQSEPVSILNTYYPNFFKQKNVTDKEKRLKSKQFAIAWFSTRQYNLLQNFVSWPDQTRVYNNLADLDFFSPFEKSKNSAALHAPINKNENTILQNFESAYINQTQLDNKLESNPINLINHTFNKHNNLKEYGFSTKLHTGLESDIGIYSLAHKLSSIGFRNGNSDIDIYPFKYNDSYRYNFQNMNLSNQRLKSFLGLSGSNHKTQEASEWTRDKRENTNAEQSLMSGNKTHFSNFRKFLDFQNPIFSKIYAPVFQPQDLNLLSFITNSFLNVIPNSVTNSQSLVSPFLENKNRNPSVFSNSENTDAQVLPIINENFQATPKTLKMLNNFYHKLPINGIHVNSYPWITQNSSERWSTSNYLWTRLSDSSSLRSFSKIKPDSSQANDLFLNGLKNSDPSQLLTNANKELPVVSQKDLFKNGDLQSRYFDETRSCIKKPSIFFSSFRHLPYFFISETLSKKYVTFPQANLSLFPLQNSPNSQLWKSTNNNSTDLLIPKYYLFQNHGLKENEKKKVIEPWKGFLQHKSYSLKPLSTFIKKEVGYETSLFSWVPKKCSKTNEKIKGHRFQSRKNSIRNNALPSIEKNTWKVFPPLFQPLTFRFIDLNLPRTWSSELFLSMFKDTYLNANRSGVSNRFKNTDIKKKPFGSHPIASHILSPLEQRKHRIEQHKNPDRLPQNTKWNMTQKNFFHFSLPFYFSDFFNFSASVLPNSNSFSNQVSPGKDIRSDISDFDIRMLNGKNQSNTKTAPFSNNYGNDQNKRFYESAFPLTDIVTAEQYKQLSSNNQKFEKKNVRSVLNETPKFNNSKIIVYGEKPLLKNRTAHGPPLKNQKESISLPSYLKNITNQNYQNLCPNNLSELYFVFWILFNKTLFIYLSLHYLRKFISFLGTEYIRNLFKIFVTMKFIDGNILSIIKTFQDFNFQLNQQNVIDIKVNKQLKNIKRN